MAKDKKSKLSAPPLELAPLPVDPPKTPRRRQYAAAKAGRLLFSASTTSADAELYSSHRQLRDRSRTLCRDNPYAKRAKQLVVNHIIGAGMGLQCQIANSRKRPVAKLNDAIESAWKDWCEPARCHTGGGLHFSDIERAAMGEIFETGEAIIRIHARPFGDSRIPLALELIESERLADDYEIQPQLGGTVRMGIEQDDYGRPLAYYVHRFHRDLTHRHPRPDEILRIPADQVFHLRLIERWPQTRGVPWMHAAIGRLHQLGEYEDAALVAARIGASKVGFFESPDGDPMAMADGEEADGTPNLTVEAGQFTQLPPGYKFSSWDPNYPTDGFEPFTRASLRGIAAAVGPCYESLSRDYSQSNYSSSRLALLDDRDLWQILQQWWVRAFRRPLHRQWLMSAVLADSIPGIKQDDYLANPARFEAVKFKARGWRWVDPTKEVNAYKEAERAGYMTKTDIIAQTGGGADIEDVLETRRRELDMIAELGLTTDTTHGEAVPADRETAPTDSDEPPESPTSDDDVEPAPRRVIPLRGPSL
jgi:lambda family phage portal protein